VTGGSGGVNVWKGCGLRLRESVSLLYAKKMAWCVCC
jgi:hypothetical protein